MLLQRNTIQPPVPSHTSAIAVKHPRISCRSCEIGCHSNSTSFRSRDGKVHNNRQKSRLQRYHYWILLIRHASQCRRPQGKCNIPRCYEAKRISDHIKDCRQGSSCEFPHCVLSKTLISHYMQCSRNRRVGKKCPICAPVKAAIRQEKLKDELERITQDLKAVNFGIDVGDELFGCVGAPNIHEEVEEEV